MRRLTTATLVAAGLAAMTTCASAATYDLQGTIGVETATAACGILPYVEQGNLFKVLYRPAGLGDNGNSTALLVSTGDINGDSIDGIIAILVGFMIEPGSLTATYQTARASEVKPTEALALNFTRYSVAMRLVEQTPPILTRNTKLVTMRLQIRKFGNVSQCTVTFRGLLRLGKSTPWIFE
jgi:hypothetical protein